MCTNLLRETVHGINSFVDVGGVPDVHIPSERSCVWY